MCRDALRNNWNDHHRAAHSHRRIQLQSLLPVQQTQDKHGEKEQDQEKQTLLLTLRLTKSQSTPCAILNLLCGEGMVVCICDENAIRL